MQTYLGVFPTQPLDRPGPDHRKLRWRTPRPPDTSSSEMVEAAHLAGCKAGLLTFDPTRWLSCARTWRCPTSLRPRTRRSVSRRLGFDFVLILPFDRATAALSAADFMRQIVARVPLCRRCGRPRLRPGPRAQGERGTGWEISGRNCGYAVRVTPVYDWHGEPVRSSRIRSLLADDGAVGRAAELLGRP